MKELRCVQLDSDDILTIFTDLTGLVHIKSEETGSSLIIFNDKDEVRQFVSWLLKFCEEPD